MNKQQDIILSLVLESRARLGKGHEWERGNGSASYHCLPTPSGPSAEGLSSFGFTGERAGREKGSLSSFPCSARGRKRQRCIPQVGRRRPGSDAGAGSTAGCMFLGAPWGHSSLVSATGLEAHSAQAPEGDLAGSMRTAPG